MDGVKSELVVPSGHGAHQNPKAIQEVRRILTLNAEHGEPRQSSTKRSASCSATATFIAPKRKPIGSF